MRSRQLYRKILAVLAILLVLFAAVGYADEEERTDATGQWRYVLEGGGATITKHLQWPGGELVIPAELDGSVVTAIGKYAFSLEESLTGVTIPEGVTSIGNGAFARCTSLTSVVIPGSVTSIGIRAFEGSGITSITIPDGVTHIGLNAFSLCADLTNVTIPKGVTRIEYGTFSYNHSLASIAIPDSVTSIDEQAFAYCDGLTDVILPDSITSIGENAFEQCTSLTSLAIPASVTTIGQNAFKDCANLTLEVFAYSDAEQYAMDNGIPFITVRDENTTASIRWKYALEDGGAVIERCVKNPGENLLIPGELDGTPVTGIGDSAFARLNITSVTIPDSVTAIGDFAFFECSRLADVATIPASVIRMGVNPFARCSLETIRVSPDNPVYGATKGVLFDKEQKMLVAYPGEKSGKYAVPKGTLRIGESAFEWSVSLTGVTIPGSVTDIGARAFYMCQELTSASIAKGVARIGDEAFFDCRRLKKVTIPGSVTSIGYRAFFGCARLKTATLQKGVMEIGDGAFESCTELTKVTIPDGVTSIGDSAFFGCERLKKLTIPDSVTSIGADAFDNFHSDLTLSVKQGSYAEQYAQEYGIPYVLVTK